MSSRHSAKDLIIFSHLICTWTSWCRYYYLSAGRKEHLDSREDQWLVQVHSSLSGRVRTQPQICLAAKLVLLTTMSLGPESHMIPYLPETSFHAYRESIGFCFLSPKEADSLHFQEFLQDCSKWFNKILKYGIGQHFHLFYLLDSKAQI